uniref:Uncharacterized protein n=1 Tax=Vibrio splendidus TaxID=29497 RepID=A0A0H3ZZ83_VIBSP|nr:hypothetical protein [Vibrio splendidus]
MHVNRTNCLSFNQMRALDILVTQDHLFKNSRKRPLFKRPFFDL